LASTRINSYIDQRPLHHLLLTTIDTPIGARTPEQTQHVIDSVKAHFQVAQEYFAEGAQSLQFFLSPNQSETKENFLALTNDLRKTGDMAFLRNTDHGLLITVVRKPSATGKPRVKLPLALFFATIATVFIYGFLWGPVIGYKQTLNQDLTIGAIFAASLMGIIGIHEMGHKVASWYHKMDSSWPYFIPFPPIPGVTLPTMGAVISAKDPPPNKDALFDLGISGPMAGLITTLVVSILAAYTASVVPLGSVTGATASADIFTSYLITLTHPGQNGVISGSLFGALYFAYSLGFLLTFVNLLPAWQLDGGHIANASVSPRVHKYLTYISAGIMLLTILLLFFASRVPSLRPLDDVSPLSGNRKIMFWATWIIAAAIFVFVVYNNSFFWLPITNYL
jgi:membrane-associated protease RseP (regulator of RpoE activity)